MKTTTTLIKGIIIFTVDCFYDERGFFYESWQKINYKELGIQEDFLQDNISSSKKNVLRGLHFQTSSAAQGQLLTILEGEIFDICVDLRIDSPTFGQTLQLNLSSHNLQQVYMPPGIAHGYCVLSKTALLHYKCTKYYSPTLESGIIWNDSTLKIKWPIKSPIMSEKDKNYPSFEEVFANNV